MLKSERYIPKGYGAVHISFVPTRWINIWVEAKGEGSGNAEEKEDHRRFNMMWNTAGGHHGREILKTKWNTA